MVPALPTLDWQTVFRHSFTGLYRDRPLLIGGACLRICGLATFAWCCFGLPLAAQDSRAPEYRSKANFLAAFPSFVDWPDTAFSSAQAPLFLCVRGDFSFGTLLAEQARGTSPHGRRIEVRWVHNDQDLRACHIVFISRSETKRYTKLLQTLEGTCALTVGETEDFLASGGAICFSFERESLRFEVNLAAAENAHLKINSRLLTLARRVLNGMGAAKS
jgi:hypothetical protein